MNCDKIDPENTDQRFTARCLRPRDHEHACAFETYALGWYTYELRELLTMNCEDRVAAARLLVVGTSARVKP